MTAINPPLAALCALILAGCAPQGQTGTGGTAHTSVLQGRTMGTAYTVKYLGRPGLPPPQEIQRQLDGLLEEVNRQMSTYRPDSEISRFNQMRDTGRPLPVSADFAAVTAEALRLNRLTGGALDVTVGPLVNLWGFGPDGRKAAPPSPAEIEQAAQMVGTDKISLVRNGRTNTLAKNHPNAYLDLSSIAKGFGVDKLALHLEGMGINNYLVEIGGELRALGHNAQGQPWRVGIEQPNLLQGGGTQTVVPLSHCALATSGDYRNFRTDAQGRRLSHIINPATRAPISHNLASASVLADSAMTADGWSTGLFVLGEDSAMRLAEQHGLAVFLIVKNPTGGYSTEMSPAFKRLLEHPDSPCTAPPAKGLAAPDNKGTPMSTVLLTFALFVLVIIGMSVGYIFSKRSIKGSCGGISSLGMDKVCGCETPCDTLQKELDREKENGGRKED